jgi:hypothetical protein
MEEGARGLEGSTGDESEISAVDKAGLTAAATAAVGLAAF